MVISRETLGGEKIKESLLDFIDGILHMEYMESLVRYQHSPIFMSVIILTKNSEVETNFCEGVIRIDLLQMRERHNL